MKIRNLITALKRIFEKDEEILFAYLYGSHVFNTVHFESDIDVAVYLKPSDIKKHIRNACSINNPAIKSVVVD